MSESGSAEPTSSNAPARSLHRSNRLLNLLGPFIALTAVVLFFGVFDSLMNGEEAAFLTGTNLTTIAAQTATVAVAALGMTLVIIAGGIDLSVGTAIALAATATAWCLKEEAGFRFVSSVSVAKQYEPLLAAQNRLKRAESDELRLKLDKANRTSTDEGKGGATLTTPGGKWTDDDEVRLVKAVAAKEAAVEEVAVEQERYRPIKRMFDRTVVPLAVMAGVLVGALCGLLNGALVSYLRVVPFIVTLGTMQLYLGLAKKIASETTVRPDRAAHIPDWIPDLLSVRPEALWLGLPSGAWLTLVLAALLSAVLHWTVFGRHVFALGSNEATARLCGINIRWNKIAVYALSGLFVGIAGLFQFSRLTVGNPSSGTGLELKIIAAVVIGGGSLSGGRGTVLGTLTGALIMSVITSGCTMLGLQNPVQDMILGVIIVAAVTLDQVRQKSFK